MNFPYGIIMINIVLDVHKVGYIWGKVFGIKRVQNQVFEVK